MPTMCRTAYDLAVAMGLTGPGREVSTNELASYANQRGVSVVFHNDGIVVGGVKQYYPFTEADFIAQVDNAKRGVA